jgi:hypothetical protein
LECPDLDNDSAPKNFWQTLAHDFLSEDGLKAELGQFPHEMVCREIQTAGADLSSKVTDAMVRTFARSAGCQLVNRYAEADAIYDKVG